MKTVVVILQDASWIVVGMMLLTFKVCIRRYGAEMSGRETSGLLAVREAKCFPDRWRFRKVVGTKVSERAHTWFALSSGNAADPIPLGLFEIALRAKKAF